MHISGVSFKAYREVDKGVKHPDEQVINALNNARPYLRQIGNSMPYPRDLLIELSEDSCDTFISAYDYNKKNDRKKLLARGNEHTLTEHGLDFVKKVFCGLKDNNEKEFKNIAANFVTKLDWVMFEQHPIKFEFSKDFYLDPHPACEDD